MPINAAPQRGYQDWGRVNDWDSPLIYSVGRLATQNSDVSGVIDVSRYGYIAGYNLVLTTTALLTASWFSDAAGTVLVGTRQILLHPNMAGAAQLRMPNMGPFVQLAWAGSGGGNFGNTARLFATNRYSPLELIPNSPQLMARNAVAIGAATNVNVFPFGYYAGPVSCVASSASGGVTFTPQTMDTGGNIVNFSATTTPAAGTLAQFAFVAPPGAWWIIVINPGAATNYSITAIQSMTGST
jgi:hypothetical protein